MSYLFLNTLLDGNKLMLIELKFFTWSLKVFVSLTENVTFFSLIIITYFVQQMVRQLVTNGANSIWEHSLLDPNQMKSGLRKPNQKDRVQ